MQHTASVDPGNRRIDLVAGLVASAFRLPAAAIRANRRGHAPAAFARQVAMYIAHTRLGLSYTAVGSSFGRDRTTAAHACRTVEERREDPAIDALVDLLERAIDSCPSPRADRP